MHVIAAKAVAFLEALQPEFKLYQAQVLANARAMCARLSQRGFNIVSGGTDNHLFPDEPDQPRNHRQGGRCGHWDGPSSRSTRTRSPMIRARLPSPADCASAPRRPPPAASRSRRSPWFADFIADVLDANGAAEVVERTRTRVLELCRAFPVYARNGSRRDAPCTVPSAIISKPRSSTSRLAGEGRQIRRRPRVPVLWWNASRPLRPPSSSCPCGQERSDPRALR